MQLCRHGPDHCMGLPKSLCTYFPKEEIAELEKACQALVAPWDPLLEELSLQDRMMAPKALEEKLGKTLAHILSEAPVAKIIPPVVNEQMAKPPVESKEKPKRVYISLDPSSTPSSMLRLLKGKINRKKMSKASKDLASMDKKKAPIEKKK